MATYKQVGYGAKGSDVTELQKLLNNNGYTLDIDGSFGPKTQAAVKDYQQKNGLKVDGIVGNNTWGALTKAATQATTPAATQTTPKPSASTATTTPTPTVSKEWSYDPFQASSETTAANNARQEAAAQKPGDFSYGAYEKSDAVKQAEALLQQQMANKPGAYQSQWQTALDDTMDKILNREKFSYDLNGDALYQQYKDQYVMQGQQAMMDTMGQAAAMTGGYGNSYAQTAGQQTYQGYLQQLNDRVPELYQMALDQYNREGDALYNQYGLYADRENQDYGRYRDTVSDYYTELDRLTEDSRYQGEQDYGRYMDALNLAYGQHRDTVSDYYTELDRLTEDSRYQGEQDYGRYMDALNLAYGVHRDSVSDWQQEQARADENYWNLYDRDYNEYANNRNLSYQQNRDQVSDAQWNQSFQYQQNRDQVSDSQWDQSFQYQQNRDKKSDEQWQTEFDEAKRQYDQQYALSKSSRSSGGGNNSTGGSGYDNGSVKDANIKAMQEALGITADGKWGPESQEAAGGMSADEAWAAYQSGQLGTVPQLADNANVSSFENNIHPESEHDAIARQMYGSYRDYVDNEIEKAWAAGKLTDDEAVYLFSKYGIYD